MLFLFENTQRQSVCATYPVYELSGAALPFPYDLHIDEQVFRHDNRDEMSEPDRFNAAFRSSSASD
jgi:hypothetical protein